MSSNRLKVILPPFPLGVAYLASNTDSRHKVEIVDLMFSEDYKAELRRAIAAFGPDLIAMSLRNVDNQDCADPVMYIDQDREVAEICRECSSAQIVLGGGAFSTYPMNYLRYLQADLGLVGEGERAFNFLLDAMERGHGYADVPGLVYVEDERIVVNPPEAIQDLDSLEPPAWGFFDLERYQEENARVTYQDKRGCHYCCAYCYTPFLEGRAFRLRSPGKVLDELDVLHREYGVRRVAFVDSVFNEPPEYMGDICRGIIARDLRLEWLALFYPLHFSRESLKLMKDAGCDLLLVGCDSGSEKMLKVYSKEFEKEDVERACRYCEELGISYYCPLLIGGPGENRETVEESVAFFDSVHPEYITVTVGIRLYPGIPLAERAVEEGLIEPDDDLFWPRFYVSPEVQSWIDEYVLGLAAKDPKWRPHITE